MATVLSKSELTHHRLKTLRSKTLRSKTLRKPHLAPESPGTWPPRETPNDRLKIPTLKPKHRPTQPSMSPNMTLCCPKSTRLTPSTPLRNPTPECPLDSEGRSVEPRRTSKRTERLTRRLEDSIDEWNFRRDCRMEHLWSRSSSLESLRMWTATAIRWPLSASNQEMT